MTNKIYITDDNYDFLKNYGFDVVLTDMCNRNKYNHISELTTQEFITQLSIRADTYDSLMRSGHLADKFCENWLNMSNSDEVVINDTSISDVMIDIPKMIRPDMPIDLQQMAKEIMERNTCECEPGAKTLSEFDSITPLSVGMLRDMTTVANLKSLKNSDSYSANVLRAPFNLALKNEYQAEDGWISININIGDSSNEEILADLSQALNMWRNETKIPDVSSLPRASRNNLKKAINNKYFLLLDAMILNVVLGGGITDTMILNVVYPHMQIEPDSLRKTYKKNALAFGNSRCITAWEQTLIRECLWDKTVKEALTKNF
ncbi:DUF6387 family protein [Aeromonas jandaei]